jgi:hypothetical protein
MATVASLIASAKKRLSFWNSDYENSVALADLLDWMKDICANYPWWFLQVIPGTTSLVQQFPFDDLTDLTAYSNAIVTGIGGSAGWVDRGWLRVNAGQSRYPVWAPALPINHDTDASNWSQVGISRIQFVKQFDYNGVFMADLECASDVDRIGSFTTYGNRGKPVTCWFETVATETLGENSYINFTPIPDQTYLYQISFVMKQSPMYDVGLSASNMFMNAYPEVCKYAIIIKACEYFEESEARKQYEEILWGNPPKGKTLSVQNACGLIANARRDSQNRYRQASQTMPQYLGARGALGRGGTSGGRRSYRRGWYSAD